MNVLFLGLDASKGYVDTKILNEAASQLAGSGRYDDTVAGHAALRDALLEVQERYPGGVRWEIGLEASGGLERNWLRFLNAFVAGSDSRVYRLNPLAVKRYRERELHQSITDPASARDLALYLRSGRRRADQPYEPEAEGPRVLYRLVCNQIDRHTQLQNELISLLPSVQPELVQHCREGFPQWLLRVLVRYPTAPALARAAAKTLARIPWVTSERAAALITAAKESVAALRDPETGQSIRLLAQELLRQEQQIAKLKRGLIAQFQADAMVRLLCTIPGIGAWTAIMLRLELGPMDRFPTADAVVAFAGLDPSYHQSGDGTVRHGISKRGKKAIRAALYMNVMAGLRCNPAIQAFYAHLMQRGKLHSVAMVACMAKLLRIAYACVITGQAFDPDRDAAVRARYAAKAAATTSGPAAPPAKEGAEGTAASTAAPVSRREAARRRKANQQREDKKAAAAPQERVNSRDRGHGAAMLHGSATGQANPIPDPPRSD
jgi:transposase